MRVSRTLASVLAATAVVAGTLFAASSASAAPPLPARMAALGDSITQAAMTCSALTSCPANSWSTGTTASVDSHALRLKALGATGLVAYNDAVSGAASAALPGQASSAASQGAQYVTIEMGANDACTSTVAGMTSTSTFTANVQAALATLSSSTAHPQIFVASVPNLLRMYNLNKNNAIARFVWAIFGTCKSMLANPTSTAAADVARRNAVQAQVDALQRRARGRVRRHRELPVRRRRRRELPVHDLGHLDARLLPPVADRPGASRGRHVGGLAVGLLT